MKVETCMGTMELQCVEEAPEQVLKRPTGGA